MLLSVDPIAMKELHSQELLPCVERCGLRDAHALFRGGGNVRRDFIHLGFEFSWAEVRVITRKPEAVKAFLRRASFDIRAS